MSGFGTGGFHSSGSASVAGDTSTTALSGSSTNGASSNLVDANSAELVLDTNSAYTLVVNVIGRRDDGVTASVWLIVTVFVSTSITVVDGDAVADCMTPNAPGGLFSQGGSVPGWPMPAFANPSGTTLRITCAGIADGHTVKFNARVTANKVAA